MTVSAPILTLSAAFLLSAWQPSQLAPAPSASDLAWMNEDVVYIMTRQERAAYKDLKTAEERSEFRKQFWLRRDPTPGTEANEFKEEHYRRISYVNAHFPGASIDGWKTDRGRIYIVYGPPDEIESHPNGGSAHPFPYEQWLYRHIEDRDNVVFEFIDPDLNGTYRENPFVRLGPGVPVGPVVKKK